MAEEEKEKKEGKSLAERSPREWFTRPLQEMDRMFEDLDKSFERFFGEPLMERGQKFHKPSFRIPAMDVRDEGDKFSIQAEMPGVDKDDIEVEVRDDMVTLKGESKSEVKEEDEGYLRRERNVQSFYREIPLSAEVKTDESEATLENGILKIDLPKKEKEKKKSKTIEIK